MIKINQKSCNVCEVCTDICPNFVFTRENDRIFVSSQDLCCNCGHCVLHCPQNAILHEHISEQQIAQGTALKINSNTIEQLMMSRRSTRCFKPDEVSRDKIESLIHVAINAGSASNLQSESFIIVENKDMLKRLEEMTIDTMWNKGLKYATNQSIIGKLLSLRMPAKKFSNYNLYHNIIVRRRNEGQLEGMIFRKAPCLVLTHGFIFESFSTTNSALAIRNMEILAESFGLGTCWAGFFVVAAKLNRKIINAALQIDDDRQVFGALMVGHPKYRSHSIIQRGERNVRWL